MPINKECASDANSSSNVHLQKRQRTEDKTRSAMVDFDVLDCPVCFEPLTIPIFQCDNGHLACSSCCPKLSNKCHACALPVGHNRCRAMESVLDAISLPCQNAKFGCTKSLSYGEVSTHEEECIFSQCSCPAKDCCYTGSYKDLFEHCHNTHFGGRRPTVYCNRLRCGVSTRAWIKISDKIVILRECGMRLLFVVQCFRQLYGVYVTLSCIAPSAPEVGKFSCHLSYTVDGHTMTYESPEVRRNLQVSFQTPEENFMLIPRSFLRGDLLHMKLCLKKLNQE